MVYCFVLLLELSTLIAEEYDLQQVHNIWEKKVKRKSHEEDKIPFFSFRKKEILFRERERVQEKRTTNPQKKENLNRLNVT